MVNGPQQARRVKGQNAPWSLFMCGNRDSRFAASLVLWRYLRSHDRSTIFRSGLEYFLSFPSYSSLKYDIFVVCMSTKSPILIEYGQPLFVWFVTWLTERTYSSTDCTGRVGETIKRKGGVSQACLGKSTSFTLDIHNMVNWQLSKQDSHWPVSHDHIAGSCVNSSRWRELFGSCPLTSWLFY